MRCVTGEPPPLPAIRAGTDSVRETISVSLPEEIKSALDSLSETENRSRSEVVREALRDYIFVRRFRRLRSRMIPLAEEKGIFTDEDVFEQVS